VGGVGGAFGGLGEDGLWLQRPLLVAARQQGRIATPHIGLQAQADTAEGRLGHIDIEGGHLLAEAPLAGPGQRLGEGHAVKAGLHLADHQLLEPVVLQAQGQRGIGQHARLGDAFLIHPHGRIGPLDIGMGQGLAQQRCQDGIKGG